MYNLKKLKNICVTMEPVFEDMWVTWPNGQCTVSSLLLAPILRAGLEDFHCEIALGYLVGAAPNNEGHKHCWIEADELIIDPTYHQFKKLPKASNYQFGIFTPEDNQYSLYKGMCPIGPMQEDYYRRTINSTPEGWPKSEIRDVLLSL